jgi:DNA-binding IclR family transcriptional regulator
VFDRVGALRGALSVSGALARFDEAARAKAIAALKREAGLLKEKLSGG